MAERTVKGKFAPGNSQAKGMGRGGKALITPDQEVKIMLEIRKNATIDGKPNALKMLELILISQELPLTCDDVRGILKELVPYQAAKKSNEKAPVIEDEFNIVQE